MGYLCFKLLLDSLGKNLYNKIRGMKAIENTKKDNRQEICAKYPDIISIDIPPTYWRTPP